MKLPIADTLHRLAKQLIDSGAADSVEDAEAMLQSYRLTFSIGPDASSYSDQAALLTGVALGRRVFLGGVEVTGNLAVPLMVPVVPADTLIEAVRQLGGTPVSAADASTPRISIGGAARPRAAAFDMRTACAGWRGGVVPSDMPGPQAKHAVPLTAMLAASLAVSEAFSFARGERAGAGRQDVGLSLWHLDRDWLDPEASIDEPELRFLPSKLWLIGLGHLGQAYLWALGLLPYARPQELELLLQDDDLVTPSTESTSVLSTSADVGKRKTRLTAAWAERRGFTTTICERRFGTHTSRQDNEPTIALCGVDNAVARRALDQVGFDLVVEAGLGRGYEDFRALRLHVLPTSRAATELWRTDAAEGAPTDRSAYRRLAADGMDQCGVTMLAGKAVGAPFVGAVAACLVVSEVLRLLHGGRLHHAVDLHLDALEHRTIVPHQRDFGAVNPGFTTMS